MGTSPPPPSPGPSPTPGCGYDMTGYECGAQFLPEAQYFCCCPCCECDPDCGKDDWGG